MKITSLCLALSALSTAAAHAGTMGPEQIDPKQFFIELGSGISFANQAKPTINFSTWSAAPEGYSSGLGDKPLYTAGFGYMINDALNIDVSYTYRGLYSYSKFQSTGSSASTVSNPLPSRTRYFNLSSNAVMFNVTLDGNIHPGLVYTTANRGYLQPFIGGGLGASYNTVDNFHTILADGTSVATSAMLDQTKTSLAYQFNAGLEWIYDRFALDIGYRYFNAGHYKSNNFLLTHATATTTSPPIYVTPWTATLSANEVFFTAKFAF
ncbi:MAG: outer membrane beta-barrel protein [Legionellaceae bacterium]|nr:outer membrane beta-barrel protein [Legionellaceae bacterium]